MAIGIKLFKFAISIIYAIFKIVPEKKNKVLFLSRQSNTLTLDFKLLKEELLKQKPGIVVVDICSRLDDKKTGKLTFAVSLVKSLYHLATSGVCVLDAYWPAVSMLKHKKSLTVIQMWHSIGKIKKSGYQTLDMPSGRSRAMAEYMSMHRQYDYIIAGGKAWNPCYMASFNTTEDKLVNIGLPRIDYIINTAENNKKRVLEAYPQLKDKKVIVYAPTFRRNINSKRKPFYKYFNYNEYALIVKEHPNQTLKIKNDNVLTCPEFTTLELLSTCDYLITDYSAVAVEAAILNVKTYYYLYDYNEYMERNGINVDPYESMPGCAFQDGEELIAAIEAGNYPQHILDEYRKKYLPEELGTSTKKLANLVISNL